MSYYDIHKALTQSLIDLALGVTIAHENVDFDPTGLAQFIDVTMIPATTEVISKDTLDEELGIYQISIYTKSGESVKTAYELADIIALNYIHGLELTSGTQKIFIDNTSRNAGRNSGGGGGRNSNGWFVIDLSVNYIADLSR